MGHEIETTDQVVLHKEAAWHGLGIVVEDALTPQEACKIVYPWTVVQAPMYSLINGKYEAIPSVVANYRDDTWNLLGVVSDRYRPIQNNTMADFCSALIEEGGVKIETAGSIQGGKRVWMLLKGEEFKVANGDQIYPYILVSNAHDGGSSYRVTPTTIRAVCSNTLHGIIPRKDTGELLNAAIAIRHTESVMERIQEARAALQHYQKTTEKTRELMDHLAEKKLTQEECQQFFLECYTADFGEFEMNPTSKVEENRKARAMSAYASFSRRFDDERELAGPTWWNAANAYSGLVQHDLKSRGKDDADRVEKRVDSNLFGLNQYRTSMAFQRAFRHSNVA